MEAVIFCGIQASGKTTFYLERFFRTHIRLNLDMLKTRHRERVMLDACLETGQRFVVDNTTPTAQDRGSTSRPRWALAFSSSATTCTPRPVSDRQKPSEASRRARADSGHPSDLPATGGAA